MPHKCCVPNCGSKSYQGAKISFHEFPSNFARRCEWLKAISRENFSPSETTKICGYHFQESDFNRGSRHVRLKNTAVPTIFKGYPTFMADQDSSDLKSKETIDKGYASKIRLLKEANSNSNEIRVLLHPAKGKELESKVKFLSHSSVDKTSTSVLNTEEFTSESPSTQIKDNSASSNQLDKTSSSKKVNLQIGAQQDIDNLNIIRPKRAITDSDFPNKKFNRIGSYRLSSLKTYGTSILKNDACDQINTSFASRKMKISLLPKNEAVKLLNQSNCSLKTTHLVSNIEQKKSGGSIPTINVVNLPQQNAKKNCSSEKSQPNHTKFCSIRPKQPLVPKVSSEKNVDNLYILNVSTPTTAPTTRKACPANAENNNSDLPTDNADNRLNKTSPSKNSVENLLEWEEFESGDSKVVYVSTIPSKFNSSEINTSSIHHTGFLKKVKKRKNTPNHSDLQSKIRNLQSQVCKKNKKIQSLKNKMEEMSEKLEYFENDTVLQNVQKMKVIDKERLATPQMKFLLNQISNLDKKAPRWSKEVLRECVLLHAASPKAYEVLQETELFKLPKRATLMRFASLTNSQTRNDADSELESEQATHTITCAPEFDVVKNEISSDHSLDNDEEDVYFNSSITDMFGS